MTAEELFEAWRPCGSKYWTELEDREKWRWEQVAKAVNVKIGKAHSQGYQDGYDDGWPDGREA